MKEGKGGRAGRMGGKEACNGGKNERGEERWRKGEREGGAEGGKGEEEQEERTISLVGGMVVLRGRWNTSPPLN